MSYLCLIISTVLVLFDGINILPLTQLILIERLD